MDRSETYNFAMRDQNLAWRIDAKDQAFLKEFGQLFYQELTGTSR